MKSVSSQFNKKAIKSTFLLQSFISNYNKHKKNKSNSECLLKAGPSNCRKYFSRYWAETILATMTFGWPWTFDQGDPVRTWSYPCPDESLHWIRWGYVEYFFMKLSNNLFNTIIFVTLKILGNALSTPQPLETSWWQLPITKFGDPRSLFPVIVVKSVTWRNS